LGYECNKNTAMNVSKYASEIDGDFIPSLRGSDISVRRTNSSLIKKFEDEFQRKVWFVEAEEATDRRSLKTSFFTVKVLTVNLIWLPNGS
jgi:hypothetical protein